MSRVMMSQTLTGSAAHKKFELVLLRLILAVKKQDFHTNKIGAMGTDEEMVDPETLFVVFVFHHPPLPHSLLLNTIKLFFVGFS